MTKVRLEIDSIKINRPKKRWKLYFVVLTEHPTDSEKMVLTTLPTEPFKLSPKHDNEYSFDSNTPGSNGLHVLTRDMPPNREINVHMYLRHSRNSQRNLGEVLAGVKSELKDDAFEIVEGILGTSTIPWLIVSKLAINLIGKILKDIKDKDFGFLSAYEHFEDDFELVTENDYSKSFTGDASLVYSWSVK